MHLGDVKSKPVIHTKNSTKVNNKFRTMIGAHTYYDTDKQNHQASITLKINGTGALYTRKSIHGRNGVHDSKKVQSCMGNLFPWEPRCSNFLGY